MSKAHNTCTQYTEQYTGVLGPTHENTLRVAKTLRATFFHFDLASRKTVTFLMSCWRLFENYFWESHSVLICVNISRTLSPGGRVFNWPNVQITSDAVTGGKQSEGQNWNAHNSSYTVSKKWENIEQSVVYVERKHRKNCECCPGHYLSTSVF